MDHSSVQDWLQVRRELLAKEAEFTDRAIAAARGDITPEELAKERALLMATRERCNAAYNRAFPASRPGSDGPHVS
jgi:hypothetical protein